MFDRKPRTCFLGCMITASLLFYFNQTWAQSTADLAYQQGHYVQAITLWQQNLSNLKNDSQR